MKIEQGDLWQKHQEGHHICIPVNKERKTNGDAVMGAGLANEARLMFPDLPKKLGEFIRQNNRWASGLFCHLPNYRLFLLATKESWRETSKLTTIERSCELLAHAYRNTLRTGTLVSPIRWPIYLPKLGCGCGQLKWPSVQPVMAKYLATDDFVVLI